MPLPKLKNAPAKMNLWLLLPVLMLTACANNSPSPVCKCPVLPVPPSVTTPPPSVNYSVSASARIKAWQKKLQDTPLIQER